MRERFRRSRKCCSLILAFALAVCAASANQMAVHAAKGGSITKISVKTGKKNVTKKTYSLKVNQTVKLKVSVSPKSSKKAVSFRTGKKSVAVVSETGKVTAKKKGIVKIRITVTDKKGRKKSSWVKIKVSGKAKQMKIKITAKGKTATATLYDNVTTRAFVKKLPLTVTMMDLYGREMCYRFPKALPTDDVNDTGYKVGEIVYYPPMHSFVIMYKQNGEEFEMQKLGRIDSGLENLSGIGDTEVTFELLD